MSRTGRAVALVAALLTVLLGWPGTAGAATDARADRVLVIGVPGLDWSDVDRTGTPELWRLAQGSAIGAMSVRASRSTTCVLDGWATLGAGNRAAYPGPDEGMPPVPLPTVPLPEDQPGGAAAPTDGGTAAPTLDTSLSHCGLQEQEAGLGIPDPAAAVRRVAQDAGTQSFGAQPAALAAAVGCATVSGPAATLAAAASGVRLTRAARLPDAPDQLSRLLGRCPLSLISLDDLTDAGRPGAEQSDEGTVPTLRTAALAHLDSVVGRLRSAAAALPGSTLVLLQGVSEVNDGRPQLHVGIASGPGFSAPAWLSSASTGRAPFVQLIDVAPTALQALGRPVPASMNGQPMQASGARPALAEAVSALDHVNTAALVHYRNTGVFFWTLVVLLAVLVAAGIWALGGRLRVGRWGPGPERRAGPSGAALLRTGALLVAALPVASYLAGLVPWEASGSPALTMTLSVVAADLIVAAVALLGPWRGRRLGPPVVVLAITLGTVIGDVLTGSHLELNGLLGYDAIVAGRFVGYGNLTFGLLSVSSLLLAAAIATVLVRRAGSPDDSRRSRRLAGGTVLVLGLATVAVIGAPGLGRDFGGVLAALPGFLLLAMLLARMRVTVVRMIAVLGAAVLVVGTIAFLDWLRPADQRTHLGRFVEQLLTGEAWTVVSRKGQANLDILIGSPISWMLPVAAVAAFWLVGPRGLLRSRDGARRPGGLPVRDVAVLRSGLLACALSLAIGAAVNDSGVALPATAAGLLVPLLIWLAAAPDAPPPGSGEPESGAPHTDPAEDPDRVTVVSRGSTDWNA